MRVEEISQIKMWINAITATYFLTAIKNKDTSRKWIIQNAILLKKDGHIISTGTAQLWQCDSEAVILASYLMSLMMLLTGSSAVSLSSCFTLCCSGAGKLTKAAKSFRNSPLLWNWLKTVRSEFDMLTGPPSTTSVPLSTARKTFLPCSSALIRSLETP